MDETEFNDGNGNPFPSNCDAKTRKWLTRLAKTFLKFVTVPENTVLAYSAALRKDTDPADPMSAWAIQFCEAAGERVGGHRDGELIYKGFEFCLSGFVSWLQSKNYYDIYVSVDLSSYREEDDVRIPHVRISGFRKNGRPFAIVIHTTPHPDIPPLYKVGEGDEQAEDK